MDRMSSRVTVVLALKELRRAKSRLAGAVGSAEQREQLVAAMFADTVVAAQQSGVERLVVVSPDPRVRALAAELGVHGLDEPAGGAAAGAPARGLNAALRHGAAAARLAGARTVVYLQADLPALTPASLRAAIEAAGAHPAAFVADRPGDGTALLAVGPGSDFPPAFGADSAAAHRNAGAVELDPQRHRWPDLRCDVDTPEDLRAAAALGLGPRTAAVHGGTAVQDGARDRRR